MERVGLSWGSAEVLLGGVGGVVAADVIITGRLVIVGAFAFDDSAIVEVIGLGESRGALSIGMISVSRERGGVTALLSRLSSLLLKTRTAASAQVGNGLGTTVGFIAVGRVVLVAVDAWRTGVVSPHISCRLLRVSAATFFAFSVLRKCKASSLPP